jgi:hypothetical protein
MEVLWNKPGHQATVFVEITENTLKAVPGILDPSQDDYTDPDASEPAPTWDLFNTPIAGWMEHRAGWTSGQTRHSHDQASRQT